MTHFLNIALAQVEGSPKPEDNLITARRFAADASSKGADILVFPEMFMALPQKTDSLTDVAEATDGHFSREMGKIAGEYHLFIVAGLWEKIPESRLVRNAAVMLSPDGKILTVYRKLHLFNALNGRESDTMAPGDELPAIVKIKGFNVSLAICYDLRFPELFRNIAFRGAELVIVPSGWYAGLLKEDHWLTLLRARAIENTIYVAGANLTGSAFCGRSTVFDPFGVPKASAGEGVELLAARIESGRIDEVRSKLPALKHCRTDLLKP